MIKRKKYFAVSAEKSIKILKTVGLNQKKPMKYFGNL